MPNWVFNTLTIEGNPEIVTKLQNQVNTPFVRQHEEYDRETQSYIQKDVSYDNPVFSFWNIIKPDNVEAYNKKPDTSVPFEEAILHKGDYWYDFNNREWGTKWDVACPNNNEYSNTYMHSPVPNGDNLVLVYSFDTAWSPPVPAMIKLSEQYPDLLLTLDWQEEQGFGGQIEFLRGEINSESDYDSKCDECDEIDCIDYCDDCESNYCTKCGFNEEECQSHGVQSEAGVSK